MRLGPLGIDLDKIDLASLGEGAIQSHSLHFNHSKRIIDLRVEDPDTFNEPWSGIQRYDRVERPMIEEVCAENNLHLFNYGVPVAERPDF